jgi:hypothetical protein
MKLRGDLRIDLAPQWAVGLRADLPFVAKNPISSTNPAGNYLFGLGDADVHSTRCSEIPSPFLKAYSETRQQRINSGRSLPIQYLPC